MYVCKRASLKLSIQNSNIIPHIKLIIISMFLTKNEIGPFKISGVYTYRKINKRFK